MTYYRNYIEERINYLKITMGECYFKFNEKDIINQIKSELTDEQLEYLNIPLVLNEYGTNNKCKASLNNIHVGVFEYNDIPWIREKIDSWIIQDKYSIQECIDELRDEYVNDNISKGMKNSRFFTELKELQLKGEELGYNLRCEKC